MKSVSRFDRILTVMLLGVSIIATVTFMPWVGVFTEVRGQIVIFTLAFIWTGNLGWILRSRALCRVGVWGGYFYLFLVLGATLPDRDAYDLPNYSTEFLVVRLLGFSLIALTLIASFRLGLRQIGQSSIGKFENMIIEKVGGMRKTLMALLFVFSGIATLTAMPWTGIFNAWEPLQKIIIPVLLFAGCFGWISRKNWCCALGVFGSYVYLFMVVCSFMPENSKGYSTEFLIARLLALAFIALVLIACFRIGTRHIQNEKAAQPEITQGKEEG